MLCFSPELPAGAGRGVNDPERRESCIGAIMPVRRLTFICLLAALAVPARAATVTIGPNPCPAPPAAAAYAPEARVVSPDARDGVRPGARSAPEFWPPEVLTVEVPGGALGRPLFLWFDGEVFGPAESGAVAAGCSTRP